MRRKICKALTGVMAVIAGGAVLSGALLMKTQAAPIIMPDGTAFDPLYYADTYPDLKEVFGYDTEALWNHYKCYGKDEGRRCIPEYGPETNGSITAEPVQTGPVPFTAHPVEADARKYFQRSVFVGDSVMEGFRNYAVWHKDCPISEATFLAVPSYTAWRAVKSSGSIQPLYKGKKQCVCDNLSLMDVDRVFILFGANDLLMKDAEHVAEDVFVLVDQIHATHPEIEVHIISMTPVFAGVNKAALSNPSIDKYNSLLLQGATVRGDYYVDINTGLKDEQGNLPARYCWDQMVHETNAAYEEVWEPIFLRYATSAE